MPDSYVLTKSDGPSAVDILDELAAVYHIIYAEPPYSSDLLFDLESFRARTTTQASRDGFTIVCARSSAGQLIGFSFGLPFEEGRWWSGGTTPPPPEVLAVPKFAVIELVLLKQWRGRGIGRELLRNLLEGRPEPFATLCAHPQAPARQMYERWGWTRCGRSEPAAASLTLEVLILPAAQFPAGPGNPHP